MKKILVLSFFLSCASIYPEKQALTRATGCDVDENDPQVCHEDAPITEQEAACVVQVVGGFVKLLTNPNNKENIAQSVGIMTTGMAGLMMNVMSRTKITRGNKHEIDQHIAHLVTIIKQKVLQEVSRRKKMEQ